MRKIVFTIAVAVIVLGGGFLSVNQYKDYQYKIDRKDKFARIHDLYLNEIEDLSVFEQADYIRNFVHKHSVHKIDGEFFSYWRNQNLILDKFYDHAAGKKKGKLHLECSTRTFIQEGLLRHLGYRTRSVDVYQFKENFPSHSFLEVFNPDSSQWEVHDPDYNVFWKNKETGNVASIEDLIRDGIVKYSPCVSKGVCGEALGTKKYKDIMRLDTYFKLAVIIDRDKNYRPLLVNKQGFDLQQAMPTSKGTLPYCEYMPKNCKQSIKIF